MMKQQSRAVLEIRSAFRTGVYLALKELLEEEIEEQRKVLEVASDETAIRRAQGAIATRSITINTPKDDDAMQEDRTGTDGQEGTKPLRRFDDEPGEAAEQPEQEFEQVSEEGTPPAPRSRPQGRRSRRRNRQYGHSPPPLTPCRVMSRSSRRRSRFPRGSRRNSRSWNSFHRRRPPLPARIPRKGNASQAAGGIRRGQRDGSGGTVYGPA